MMLSIIKTYKSKILIGIILAMLTALGLLAWQNRALIQKAAVLTAEKAQIMDANDANRATIAALQSEIVRREKASRERAKKQAKIVSEYKGTIKEREAHIEQMRAQYEEIDDFLDIHVPDSFTNEWMRKTDRYEDRDDLSAPADGDDGAG